MKILKEAIENASKKLGWEETKFGMEHPGDEKFGDYSSNIAMLLFAKFQTSNFKFQIGYKNPRELAEKLVEEIRKDRIFEENVERVEVAGVGFINFWLKDKYLLSEMKKAQEEGYGKNESGKGRMAIVEYSSPNIAKPFTIGHLRSTIIGDAVANILEENGWKVLRDNHLGDWGTQFGKQIVAIKKWGEKGKEVYTVKELVELYVKFHEEAEKDGTLEDEARSWFKKLEDGDKEARKLWKMCVDSSWQEFARIYEVLGIKHSSEFDEGRGLGESFFEDKMGVVIEELKQKKMLTVGKEEAQLVFFENEKLPPAMIIKKDGATLYITRDLATDKYRLVKYKPDLIVNEVGAEQELYFRQLYEIEQMLGWYQMGQRVHVMHGMYRFKEGKMSTRKGNVIWLAEVLSEAIKRAGELGKGNTKVAKQVGIGALKWNDLKAEPKRDILFDWSLMLKMEGDSGPYVQYTYARAQSVLRKSEIRNTKSEYSSNFETLISNLNSEELAILRWLYRYPEVVAEAGEKLLPSVIASYLYELATRFNSFYNKHQILPKSEIRNAKSETSKKSEMTGDQQTGFRIELTRAVAQTLESGLGILGIEAPEEM